MLAVILALLAVPTPAASPAPSASPVLADGTYTYVSSMAGIPIGKTTITVKRGAASVVVTEQGAATFNGREGKVSDTLALDPAQFSPLSYSLAADVDGRPMNAAVTFSGGDAYQSGDVIRKTYDLAETAKHFVLLDLGPFSGWFALPAQMEAWSDAPAVAIVPTLGSGITITPDVAIKPARPKTVPAADAAINVQTPLPFTVWYDPKSLLVDRVDFPTQGVSITRQP